MPAARKRASAPDELDAKQPANGADLDALRAEVAAEPQGARDGTLRIPLGNTKVRVLDFMDWPASANEDIGYGRYSAWARKALAEDDFAKIWAPLDPTNRQVMEFLVLWSEASGLPLGSMLTSLTS